MAKAYIRMCIEVGKESAVKRGLLKIKEIRSADITAGEQDLIAVIEGGSYEAILNVVISKIRKLNGVKITWTNFVVG